MVSLRKVLNLFSLSLIIYTVSFVIAMLSTINFSQYKNTISKTTSMQPYLEFQYILINNIKVIFVLVMGVATMGLLTIYTLLFNGFSLGILLKKINYI